MHCLTQTNKLTESRTHTNLVKEKLPPQNLQYLRREKTKKDVALIPKGMVGTAAYRHRKEEIARAKIILTTNVATNFYINITLISPRGSPRVLHNPVWNIP